ATRSPSFISRTLLDVVIVESPHRSFHDFVIAITKLSYDWSRRASLHDDLVILRFTSRPGNSCDCAEWLWLSRGGGRLVSGGHVTNPRGAGDESSRQARRAYFVCARCDVCCIRGALGHDRGSRWRRSAGRLERRAVR